MNLGLLFAFIFTLPTAVILISLNEPIIGAIYGRGNFTQEHVTAAAPALAAFALGLPAYMAMKVVSTAFFANKDTRTPFKGGMIAIITNLLFIALFMPCMKHIGIALATTLSSWCNWIYLTVKLGKLWQIRIDGSTIKECLKQLLISGIMFASILIANICYADRCYIEGETLRNLALLIVLGISIIIFLIAGKISGAFSFMKEIKSIDK
jgi:putative peptidoglycan lipid II flippase